MTYWVRPPTFAWGQLSEAYFERQIESARKAILGEVIKRCADPAVEDEEYRALVSRLIGIFHARDVFRGRNLALKARPAV